MSTTAENLDRDSRSLEIRAERTIAQRHDDRYAAGLAEVLGERPDDFLSSPDPKVAHDLKHPR